MHLKRASASGEAPWRATALPWLPHWASGDVVAALEDLGVDQQVGRRRVCTLAASTVASSGELFRRCALLAKGFWCRLQVLTTAEYPVM